MLFLTSGSIPSHCINANYSLCHAGLNLISPPLYVVFHILILMLKGLLLLCPIIPLPHHLPDLPMPPSMMPILCHLPLLYLYPLHRQLIPLPDLHWKMASLSLYLKWVPPIFPHHAGYGAGEGVVGSKFSYLNDTSRLLQFLISLLLGGLWHFTVSPSVPFFSLINFLVIIFYSFYILASDVSFFLPLFLSLSGVTAAIIGSVREQPSFSLAWLSLYQWSLYPLHFRLPCLQLRPCFIR